MGVGLTDDEAWAVLEASHTGILTTLQRDGWPIALPVWFVVLDRTIYVRTPSRSKKVARVRADDRVSFLVESGAAWAQLRAVVALARARVVDDGDVVARVAAALGRKYAGFGLPRRAVPDATRRHYGAAGVVIAVDPTGPFVTWDNSKLRLRDPVDDPQGRT